MSAGTFRPMRVLVVTTWFPTRTAPGSGAFVARDVAALAQDHDVRVLHLVAPGVDDGERSLVHDGVPVERVPMAPHRPDQVLAAAREVRARAGAADLVHTVAISSLLPLARWRPDRPWVHTEHWSGLLAPETLPPAVRVARPLAARLLRRPDVVTVVSEHLAAGLRRYRSGPVVVVPNIVPAPEHPATRDDRDLPSGADPGARPLRLVAVGGLIPRKGPVTAVRTLAALADRGVPAELTWVGEGPLRDAVVAEAGRLGLSDRVRLTGALPPERVGEHLAASDVFLLPTTAETFCVAAAEALAHGRPVVVGDSGGPADFVAPPTGELVPGQDPGAYAEAVLRVWAATRGTRAEEIAAPVRERYSAPAYRDRMAQVYAEARGDDTVEVVVAAHSPDRRTDRAVASVLAQEGAPVLVTVVCHNTDPELVAAGLPPEVRDDPRLRLLRLDDGVPSPSGPFMHGIERARAPWVSILGSDDVLEPGAVASWLAVARRTGAEVVITRLVRAGRTVPTPPTRPFRRGLLDLEKDRLSYRSAPLGLLRVSALRRLGAELMPGARVGGDVPMVTRLWAEARVAYDRNGPAYVIGEDAGDRVTYTPRPIAVELAFVRHLLTRPWFTAYPWSTRAAVVTKVSRIHLFGAVHNRPDPAFWTGAERAELAAVARELEDAAPGYAGVLSRADRALLDAILDRGDPAELVRLARARRRHGRPGTVLTRDLRHLLHREAPLRLMTASLLTR